MNARSALCDLYGDHLLPQPDEPRGHAPIACLLRLLGPLGIQAPAVRTAVSRMARQGWLTAVRLPAGPGYALTPRGVRWLDDAADRVYRRTDRAWDGRWHLLVVTSPTGGPGARGCTPSAVTSVDGPLGGGILVHDGRTFLFVDPGSPSRCCLPAGLARRRLRGPTRKPPDCSQQHAVSSPPVHHHLPGGHPCLTP